MGFVKSGSQKSLAAGGLSSLLLVYVYNELPVRPIYAASLGLGMYISLFSWLKSFVIRNVRLI